MIQNDIAACARKAIEARTFPGCVVGVVHGPVRFVGAFGRYGYESDAHPVAHDTLYDVASLTKSVVTATLVHRLLARRTLTLKTKLIEFVPEYRGGYREDITLLHLLTYTIGGIRLSEFKDSRADEILDAVLSFEPLHPPGTKFEYSNVPAFLLGLLLERISGRIDESAHAYIFKPLEMNASTFFPRGAAPTEIDTRGCVQDIVHDESAYVFRKAGKTVGHAGLFSTVPDLLTFLNAFHEGKLDARLASENRIAHLQAFTALGWELNQPHFMGTYRSPHTFGKTGYTGCSVVCDVRRNISIVILSNRTFPKRPGDAAAINAFRRTVCDIVFA